MGYLIDPASPRERRFARNLNHKLGFLRDEAGASAIEMMPTIKRARGPKNIMNLGKIFAP